MVSYKQPWQHALSDLITDPKELLLLLDLPLTLLDEVDQTAKAFPLKVPRSFVARMQKGNPHDPLLKQVLPLGVELHPIPGYRLDPLQETICNPLPGLLHKYHGRVLVTLTHACAIHCRYCFRRHFAYEKNNPGRQGWKKIVDYIRHHPDISEIILSGGDPLSVHDALLKSFTDELLSLSQIKRLRIHTRLVVVLPERVTEDLVKWLSQLPLPVVIVIHTNHPNEINCEVIQALQHLRQAHITLLNQSVLLKGINDEAHILVKLCETLFASGVLPYYLHTLDKVQGSAHFDVSLDKARQLHAELCNRLPGYLVPKLVCEEAGKLAKTLL